MTDTSGIHLASEQVWSFSTEAQPEVAGTTPLPFAATVLVDGPVTATFSKAMDGATVTETSFTLHLVSDGSIIAATVSYDTLTQTATLAPTVFLAPKTQYRAVLAATILDSRGNSLAGEHSWVFTTEARPQVTAVSPAAGTTGVPVTASLSATFSKAMAPGSISAASFTLVRTSTGEPVDGTRSYEAATLTATADPGARLEYLAQYTASLTTQVTDERGNALAETYTWSFSTEGRPSVASVTPLAGATGVAVATEISATFSTVMDPVSAAASIAVTGGDGAVSGTASYSGQTVTFLPSAPLEYQTSYTVSIAATASDGDGDAIGATYTWSFTTTRKVPPTVASTSPADGDTDVPIRSRTITLTFSEPLDAARAAGIECEVTDSRGTRLEATASYADSVLVLTLARDLQYTTSYTITVRRANVVDREGLAMQADYRWGFSTLALSESLAVNNRIDLSLPEDQRQMRLFIPEPPRGAGDRVTVAVYTASGKRVATLVAGRPYQEIVADLPLLWDGSNGRRQRLGPGLYFIQITATDYKRTLKVLIAGE